MTYIATVPPAEAGDEVARMYRRQQESWGFVPNFAKAFSHRPELMSRWAALLAEVKRPLDKRRLELVTFSAAHELRHSACSLAHGRVLREFYADEEVTAIAEGRTAGLLSPAEHAMLRFARRVARDAASIAARDVAELKEHGFSDAQVFDIAAVAAARAFFTKLLDAVGVLADGPMGELPPSLRDALAVGRPVDTAPPVSLPDGPPA